MPTGTLECLKISCLKISCLTVENSERYKKCDAARGMSSLNQNEMDILGSGDGKYEDVIWDVAPYSLVETNRRFGGF